MKHQIPSLPRAGFGLGRLHHVISRKERERILLGAYDAGLTHFDLAAAYGDGFCEAEAGRILQPHRDQISLATKFGIPSGSSGEGTPLFYFARKGLRKVFAPSYGSEYAQRDFSSEFAMRSVEASLRRLRTDYLDFFFFHEPRHTADHNAILRAVEVMDRLKDQGKIRNYGVSAQTEYFLDHGRDPVVGNAAQFELSENSHSLIATMPNGVRTSAFGLVRFFKRDDQTRCRLDYTDMLHRFFQDYPATMPILATSRPKEIARLGRALGELPLRSSDYGMKGTSF